MSCRPLSADIEPALCPSSSVNDLEATAAPATDIDARSSSDPAELAVIVVSPDDMQHLFGPTLWRMGFLPIWPSDAAHASPAPVHSGAPAATRSFSTYVWRKVHSGHGSIAAPLSQSRGIRPLTLPMHCHIRPSPSTTVGSISRAFRSYASSSARLTRTILRSVFILGPAAFRGLFGM